MASKRTSEEMATPDELVEALNKLTTDELRRLWNQGNVLALGSDYKSGRELFSEAAKRALIGTTGERAEGERGRPWPKSVDMVAFLMGCMKSIANSSQNSAKQSVDRRAAALTNEEGEANHEIGESGQHHPSVEDELIERDESAARQAAAEAEVSAIRKLFAQGDVVHDILDGEEMEMNAEDIRLASNLTFTQYDSARKKLRRTVDKHIPGRRQK